MFVIKIILGNEAHEFPFKHDRIIKYLKSFRTEVKLKYLDGLIKSLDFNSEMILTVKYLLNKINGKLTITERSTISTMLDDLVLHKVSKRYKNNWWMIALISMISFMLGAIIMN